MAYKIVDARGLDSRPGPHPAASPFDKRISDLLGLRSFELYQVELPPHAETVQHSHVEDRVEDLYAFVNGSGWVQVDNEHVPVRPGQFVAVSIESVRQVRAGDEGLVFIAVCAGPR